MTGEPRIREAEVADAAAITGVHVRSWQVVYKGLVPQWFLDRMNAEAMRPVWARLLGETSWPGRGVLVAEAGGRITAFAGVCPTRDGDQDPAAIGELAAIYLEPAEWGAGTGRRLMAAAVETLGRAGYRQATLWVLDANARARRFYEAAGWRPDGAVKVDDSRGFPLTEVRYRRALPDD